MTLTHHLNPISSKSIVAMSEAIGEMTIQIMTICPTLLIKIFL